MGPWVWTHFTGIPIAPAPEMVFLGKMKTFSSKCLQGNLGDKKILRSRKCLPRLFIIIIQIFDEAGSFWTVLVSGNSKKALMTKQLGIQKENVLQEIQVGIKVKRASHERSLHRNSSQLATSLKAPICPNCKWTGQSVGISVCQKWAEFQTTRQPANARFTASGSL